jgi:opacity protein-like surface antigen
MRLAQRHGISSMLLAVAVCLWTPGTALAQSIAQPGMWTVSPFLGGSVGINDDFGAGNSFGIGAGVGYDLTAIIGFEGEVGYLFDVAGDTGNLDWSITNVSGNFLYHFDVRHVTPYATFGIGVEHSSLDEKDTDPVALVIPSSTEISFNFGGGVKYPLTDSLLVRGDLRRFQSNDFAPDYWRLYAGLTFVLGR